SPLTRKITTNDLRIIRVLGNGGQGFVMLVQDRATENLLALKSVAKHSVPLEDDARIFEEQDVLRRLAGNSRFLDLQASFENSDYFCFLTDYYPGGDMKDFLALRGKLPEHEARDYYAQLLLALQELHSRRIIHRDIKPENVLIAADGRLVLADFGMARAFGRTADQQPTMFANGAPAAEIDKTESGCGTARYMAPEQFDPGCYSYGVDTWALGVMLYEMLHGELPFKMTACSEAWKIVDYVLDGKLEVDDSLSDEAYDLVCTVLAKDPLKRPTCDEIIAHAWFDGQ
ncbi:kinase-like domain-containing protein, partial [Epithele typhae]|uniref:kinase-like domain-containing protein n=1 Tax=Epithele typhae TaxID=378194 RepID=UPI0020086B86